VALTVSPLLVALWAVASFEANTVLVAGVSSITSHVRDSSLI
jgi:hypothetical protein